MPLSIFSLSRTRRLSSRDGLLLKFMSLTSSSSSMSSSNMSLQGAFLHVLYHAGPGIADDHLQMREPYVLLSRRLLCQTLSAASSAMKLSCMQHSWAV